MKVGNHLYVFQYSKMYFTRFIFPWVIVTSSELYTEFLKYSHESWKSATCFSMFKNVFFMIQFSVRDCDFMQALYVTKTLDRHLD